jgi:hypothetical protein
MWRCRFNSKAGAALALCAALWIVLSPADANADVTQVNAKFGLAFASAAGDADVAGTVVESTAGSKSVTGGAFDLGGIDRSGQFEVRGKKNTSYTCTLPSQITLSAGANTVTVDTFVTDPALSGTFPGSGRTNIDVGATLQLPAAQPAGTYSGTLIMTCEGFSDFIDVTLTLGTFISISNTGSLNFGKAAPTGTAGTVTITAAGARSAVNVDLFGGGTVGAAGFSVTGYNSQTYAITLPSSATLTSGGNTMTVDTFTHDAGGSPTLAAGSDSFNVGATLHVGASQAAGAYTANFTVTVSYN